MTREKKPLLKVLDKYEDFLKSLITNSDGCELTIDELIKEFQINKYIKKALIDLKIIDLETDKKWHWLSFQVDKNLILTVLNYILERSKKTVQPNLPLDGFTKALEQQNEILEYLKAVKQDRSPNGFKMPLKETNLFEKEDQRHKDRLYLAGLAMQGLIQNAPTGNLHNSSEGTDLALQWADELLTKLYSKQKVTQ
jgi:hypothetical protein